MYETKFDGCKRRKKNRTREGGTKTGNANNQCALYTKVTWEAKNSLISIHFASRGSYIQNFIQKDELFRILWVKIEAMGKNGEHKPFSPQRWRKGNGESGIKRGKRQKQFSFYHTNWTCTMEIEKSTIASHSQYAPYTHVYSKQSVAR